MPINQALLQGCFKNKPVLNMYKKQKDKEMLSLSSLWCVCGAIAEASGFVNVDKHIKKCLQRLTKSTCASSAPQARIGKVAAYV